MGGGGGGGERGAVGGLDEHAAVCVQSDHVTVITSACVDWGLPIGAIRGRRTVALQVGTAAAHQAFSTVANAPSPSTQIRCRDSGEM